MVCYFVRDTHKVMTSLIFVEEVLGWLEPTHHLNNDFLTFLEEFFTAITLVYFMKKLL
jgi:hypothetical protein